MAAMAVATRVTGILYSPSYRLRQTPGDRHLTRLAFGFPAIDRPSTSCVLVRASEPQREEATSSATETDGDSTFQEDLNYLLKLGAGSFIGAAAIKYGSIVFPDITRPDIFEALTMISTPVIVAVLLLIRQSRLEQ